MLQYKIKIKLIVINLREKEVIRHTAHEYFLKTLPRRWKQQLTETCKRHTTIIMY
jgi:predicted GIY-YIG superfamily endonuclease